MQDYLDQVRKVASTDLYFITLSAALVIADMCAGLGSDDGETKGYRYEAWVDANLSPKYTVGPMRTPSFSGKDCWGLRCALLHQGYLQPHKGAYKRVIFVEPHSGGVLQNNVINDALNIDVARFALEMVESAEKWVRNNKDTDNYKKNYPNYMHRYPNGIAPYVVGIPVIG